LKAFGYERFFMPFPNHQQPTILFDGVCNFCNAGINFIIKQDKEKVFRFAALQSDAGQKLLQHYHLPTEGFNSFVLIDSGKVYLKSAAALQIYAKLSWYWKWSQVFWVVPKFLRDAVYNLVARNRYEWFGKKEACMIPGPEVRGRFL
jgi:predicted DCC family thiol-disulfide oxidoreductase YuxK